MSQKWICISTPENTEITLEKGVWGVAHHYRKSIGRTKIGDLLLFYTRQNDSGNTINSQPEITGIVEVISNTYKDDTKIFVSPSGMESEKFPYRIKVKPLKIFKKPILFKPLIHNLSFIKNKKMWSGSIRVAMREIPESDYQKIILSEKSTVNRQ